MEVHQPTSRDRPFGGQNETQGIQGSKKGSRDLIVRRFYISLGRYLLDKNFVLNSNNILIY
jgi:hypothetical protein